MIKSQYKKLVVSLLTLVLLISPFAAQAINFSVKNLPKLQPGNQWKDLNALLDALDFVFSNLLWPIFIVFAVVMYIMAGIQFFAAKGDPMKAAEARRSLIWATAGLVVAMLAFSIPVILDSIIFPQP